MSIDLRKTLASSANDPRLGTAATEALRIIEGGAIRSEFIAPGRFSGVESARIWKARADAGKLGKSFKGVDETIAALSQVSSELQLGMIEAELGTIGIYLADDRDAPVGIIVCTYQSASTVSVSK